MEKSWKWLNELIDDFSFVTSHDLRAAKPCYHFQDTLAFGLCGEIRRGASIPGTILQFLLVYT